MDVLPYNFRACHLCGMWSESERYSLIKTAYKLTVLTAILQFTLGELIALVTIRGSLDEFAEVLFVSLSFAALCLKLLNFVLRRSEMLQLLGDFRSEVCQPRTPEEREILERYSKKAARIFLAVAGLSQSTELVFLVTPILTPGDTQLYGLPFKSYQFYDTSEAARFWWAYAVQVFASMYGVFLNVSMDTMVYGFIIMSTAQFEIICHRIANFSADFNSCIAHHVLVQEIVYKIQQFFIRVIFPLFIFSLATLCTSIFQMAEKKVASFEYLCLIMYLACMLCQVFFYCWYGNELELKSQAVMDAIYSSNWMDFTNQEKKNMWFVMLSARRGSNISFHGQCGLTLATFLWIIKTSYAAFNLLQQVST